MDYGEMKALLEGSHVQEEEATPTPWKRNWIMGSIALLTLAGWAISIW